MARVTKPVGEQERLRYVELSVLRPGHSKVGVASVEKQIRRGERPLGLLEEGVDLPQAAGIPSRRAFHKKGSSEEW